MKRFRDSYDCMPKGGDLSEPCNKALARIKALLASGSTPQHAYSTQGAGFHPAPVDKITPKPSMAGEIGYAPQPITNGLLGGTGSGDISHYRAPPPVKALKQSTRDRLMTTGPQPFCFPQGSQKKMESLKKGLIVEDPTPGNLSQLLLYNYTDTSSPMVSVNGGVAGRRRKHVPPAPPKSGFAPAFQ